MDIPYMETGLAELTNIHKLHALCSTLRERLNEAEHEDFIKFLQEVGVVYKLEVLKTSIDKNIYQQLKNKFTGIKETSHAIKDDYSISNLESYVKCKSIPASKLIWQALIRVEDRKVSKARYRPNSAYPYQEADSQFVSILKDCEWIPNRSGIFRKPLDMTREQLREGFDYNDDNGLLTAIDFGSLAKDHEQEERIFKRRGLDSPEKAEKAAKLMKKANEAGVSLEDISSFIDSKKVTQPEASVPNPERRNVHVREQFNTAPAKESVPRERAIQVGIQEDTRAAKEYLRIKYKNEEGQLICQCCHKEMPFKLKDGEYYFEAIQCLKLDRFFHQNRLALCPTCAAMYQHARQTSDEEIRCSIKSIPLETTLSAEIPVRLAGKEFQLRFVEAHWRDLKAAEVGVGLD
jgi:hypothetical protein